MLGPLSKLSDNELLGYVLCILARPKPITAFDETELSQIDAEIMKRHPDWESEIEQARR